MNKEIMIALMGVLLIQAQAWAAEPHADQGGVSSIRLDADFPGGSAVLKSVETVDDVAKVSIDIPAKAGWKTWWYCRLSGISPGETVQVSVKGNKARLPVYTDALSLVKHVESACDKAKGFTLAETKGGNPVPGIRINGDQQVDSKRPVVWIQARQHAWEVGGSWVAAGLAQWLVSDDPAAGNLRKHCDVVVVPIMVVRGRARVEGRRAQGSRNKRLQ